MARKTAEHETEKLGHIWDEESQQWHDWNEQTEQWEVSPDQGQPGTPDSEQHEQPELSDEEKAAALAAELAAIEDFSEAPAELLDDTTPVRKRSDLQRAMDAIAQRTYQAWVDRGRPSVWTKLPVITYYRDPEKVAERRKLIRKACDLVKAQPYTRDDGHEVKPTGVRVRFGKEAFILTEEKAAAIGRPDDAGKVVLSWSAVDKRKSTKSDNGDTADQDNGDE
jgi:hypothetical protein